MAQSQTIETRTVQCNNCGASMEVPHLSEDPLELTFKTADPEHPVFEVTTYVCSSDCRQAIIDRVEAMA